MTKMMNDTTDGDTMDVTASRANDRRSNPASTIQTPQG
jgi:hypothetical protein